MRRILVEQWRRRNAAKRGGQASRVELEEAHLVAVEPDEDVLALSDALDLLAAQDPVAAELVKLRFFAGLSVEQTAAALGLSTSTVDRRWAFARAWVYCWLHETQ